MALTKKYYVYGHFDLQSGKCFYIGQGTGKRAWNKTNRNLEWDKVVEKLHGSYDVKIIEDNLTQNEAYEVESEYIRRYGKQSDGGSLVNITDGGYGEVAIPIGITPEVAKEMVNVINEEWDKLSKEKQEAISQYYKEEEQYIKKTKKSIVNPSPKEKEKVAQRVYEMLKPLYFSFDYEIDDESDLEYQIDCAFASIVNFIEETERNEIYLSDLWEGVYEERAEIEMALDDAPEDEPKENTKFAQQLIQCLREIESELTSYQ